MRADRLKRENGVVMAAVLMVLAALSLLAVAGKGDTALQWVQLRNARDYDDAVRLADTGIARALSADRFVLGASQNGRYCRSPSRCVEWSVVHVETTAVPPGLEAGPDPARALHFEVSAEASAGRHARAPVVAGFLLIATGEPEAPLPDEIRICDGADDCPQDSARPPDPALLAGGCGMRSAGTRGFSLTELLVAAGHPGAAGGRGRAGLEPADGTGAAPGRDRRAHANRRCPGALPTSRTDAMRAPANWPRRRRAGSESRERNAATTRLELRAMGGGPALGFQATATAQRPGAQAGDETCRILALDSTGARSAETAGGEDSSEACWP